MCFMRIPRIYTEQPLVENQSLVLGTVESHYISKVLRMKVGRELILFNGIPLSGQYGEYNAVITNTNKKSVTVEIKKFHSKETESPVMVELGVCLIKNDRMDWLLQKATELGVNTFSPLISEYVDVKIPADRLEKKIQHWQQIIISACEQCGRTRVPVLHKPHSFTQWVETVKAESKHILHPYNAQPFDSHSAGSSANLEALALAVGPEGGLTESEVELAHQHNFIPMSLGPRILRAETAPLAALSIIQHRLGDF